MAIISVLKRRVRNVIGDRSITTGTYKANSSGEVDTALEICEHLQLQGTATVAGSASVVNATFPRSGTAVPIVTTFGGIWFAYGR
jgi:hypothetical protein